MSQAAGTTGEHDADDLVKNPPAKLTKRGLAVLTEIWEAQGRPAEPTPTPDDHGTWTINHADIGMLRSHHGTVAKRRSAARMRPWHHCPTCTDCKGIRCADRGRRHQG
jgi:hypothetical protein